VFSLINIFCTKDFYLVNLLSNLRETSYYYMVILRILNRNIA